MDKNKILESALSQIEKNFGKGSIMKLGSAGRTEIEAISSGSPKIDWALGIGGFPCGRIIEIYGPESSGKTTLTLSLASQAQKQDKVCAFIDAEHAFDISYAEKLGINAKDLVVSQPDYGEQALEITDMLVRSNAVHVIIIDSVAALVPKAELQGEMGDSHMGLQARLMSQALRKLTSIISKTKCTVVFINQVRMKIGVMFGNPETTTGGNALKFYSSVRVEVRKVKSIQDGDKIIGNIIKVKIVKNKVAPPFKTVECDLIFGEGICKVSEIIDLGVKENIIEKAGSWFSYKNQKIAQGKENAKKYLIEHQDIYKEIEKLVYQKLDILDKKHDDNSNVDTQEKKTS